MSQPDSDFDMRNLSGLVSSRTFIEGQERVTEVTYEPILGKPGSSAPPEVESVGLKRQPLVTIDVKEICTIAGLLSLAGLSYSAMHHSSAVIGMPYVGGVVPLLPLVALGAFVMLAGLVISWTPNHRFDDTRWRRWVFPNEPPAPKAVMRLRVRFTRIHRMKYELVWWTYAARFAWIAIPLTALGLAPLTFQGEGPSSLLEPVVYFLVHDLPFWIGAACIPFAVGMRNLFLRARG